MIVGCYGTAVDRLPGQIKTSGGNIRDDNSVFLRTAIVAQRIGTYRHTFVVFKHESTTVERTDRT